MANLLIPSSMGELFDKITILQIKAARISDPGKLKNVGHELTLLEALAAENSSLSGHADLMAELKAVNEALWEIEDHIRDCEREQDFGPRFVALARAVYQTNDKRAEIKKQINVLSGYDIVEEKSYAPTS